MRLEQKNAGRIAKEKPKVSQPIGVVPTWKPTLSDYAEQRILSFQSTKELELAIDLIWTKDLRAMPHATPDGESLIVPSEAVPFFIRAGLRFTEKRLRNKSG